ncbi:GLPGLI family protein [Pedobacter sp. FW305-3-2-15-E-R2A2]|uniref:GLPGLI family protein n=1 Tax=Pedobacter sp. FW305-3-2-15-E-R2A2 TaxID=3140251 RepID=UPI003140306D
MMKRLASFLLLISAWTGLKAQQLFIPYGKISFEKKVNLQRSLAEWDIPDEAKEKIKKYKSTNWELSFNRTKSIFKSVKQEEEQTNNLFFDFAGEPENELYADYQKQNRVLKKRIMGDDYLLNDTIPKVDWKIMHDIRNIAGYECRKAIGKINDTVYVVAFYTDEILLRGGPEGFSGLPGMILGLAIPRYYTTWFATKVAAFTNPSTDIVPPSKGKKTDTEKDLKKLLEIFTRYDEQKKEKPEEHKKRLYGFIL